MRGEDLTSRLEAEDERDRFFELSLDMFCVSSADEGRFLRVNGAFARTLGWEEQDLVSTPFLDFVHPDDREATIQEVERQSAGGSVLHFENRYRHRDGSYRRLAWTSVPRPGGLMYATARDVTEQRRLEEALGKSEESLDVTLDSIGDAVIATDVDRRITRMNPVAEHLTGWTRAEAIGRKVEEVFRIVDELTGGPAVIPVDSVLASGTVRNLANHTALLSRNGSRRSIADSAAPIRDRDGRVVGVVLVFRDVTEQREIEDRLQRAGADLEQLVEERTAALAHSERANRATLDALPSHIAVLDETGTIVAVNRAWGRFAETNAGEVDRVGVGADYLAVCDRASRSGSPDAGRVAKGLRDVLAGRESAWELEYPCHAENEKRWFYCRITPIEGDGPGRVVVAHENVTAMRVAERALETARSRFHYLFQAVQEGIVIVDREGTIVDANPQLEEIFGWSREELVGRPIEALVPEEIHRQHIVDRETYLRSPTNRRMGVDRSRLHGVHRDGTRIALDVRLSPMVTEEGTLVAAVVRDVGEKLRAEDSLANSERRFRTLFETTQDAVTITCPPTWRFTSANPATVRMFRARDEAHLLALNPWEVSPERQLDGVPSSERAEEHIARALRDGTHHFEWQHRRLDGETFPCKVQLTRIELDGIVQLQATIRDVTDEKHMLDRLYATAVELRDANATIARDRADLAERVTERTAELTEANARLLEASRAKSEFLAAMSHELRTPLNGILGMNELLQTTELTPRQREFVAASAASGKLLAQLINDVLDLSKIEAGALELDEQVCDLDAIPYEVVGMFSPMARQRGLVLTCRIPPELCAPVRCDDHRLRQILTNLVGNAVKFTSSGRISVHVSRQAADTDQRFVVRFDVTDTGIGIPEDRRDRLFQSFSQVDGSTTRRYGGTGLGLSICKQLVELMGGRIGVESQVGEGSRFWFEVPLEFVEGATTGSAGARVLSGTRVVTVGALGDRQVVEHLIAWGCAVEPVPAFAPALDAFLSGTLVLAEGRFLADVDAQWFDRLDEFDGASLIALGMPPDEALAERLRQSERHCVLADPIRPSDLFDVLVDAVSTWRGSDPGSGDDPAASMAPTLRGHVLVAEDNEVNQLYVVELLRFLGCTCDLAANGAEALDALRRRNYDLVLMDCQMPEMDGFTATREIRRLQDSGGLPQRIPIVALTANALKGDRERCLEAGMDDYLGKPVESFALRDALQRHMLATTDPPQSADGA